MLGKVIEKTHFGVRTPKLFIIYFCIDHKCQETTAENIDYILNHNHRKNVGTSD